MKCDKIIKYSIIQISILYFKMKRDKRKFDLSFENYREMLVA